MFEISCGFFIIVGFLAFQPRKKKSMVYLNTSHKGALTKNSLRLFEFDFFTASR